MAFDFLVPVKDKVLAFSEFLPAQALGKNIHKHTKQDGLPVFANASVAIVGVLESRNAFEKKPEKMEPGRRGALTYVRVRYAGFSTRTTL